jgi:hypothetical protein
MGLVVVLSRLDLLGIPQLAGQFRRGVDQHGETLGADIDLLLQVLQGHQGNLFFGLATIQTGFRHLFSPQSDFMLNFLPYISHHELLEWYECHEFNNDIRQIRPIRLIRDKNSLPI